jgi:hypothetical protein
MLWERRTHLAADALLTIKSQIHNEVDIRTEDVGEAKRGSSDRFEGIAG